MQPEAQQKNFSENHLGRVSTSDNYRVGNDPGFFSIENHVRSKGVEIIEGSVARTGATPYCLTRRKSDGRPLHGTEL